MITQLTPEQEAFIPFYREKWRRIALSTEPINRELAAEAVKMFYTALGKQDPKIVCFNSPYEILRKLGNQLEILWKSKLCKQLHEQLLYGLYDQLDDRVNDQLFRELYAKLRVQRHLLTDAMSRQLKSDIQPRIEVALGSWADFAFSVLNCVCDRNKWDAFQGIIENSGWLIPCEAICIICDRPTKLSFDNQNRLHAEGEPAIQFADGYSLYSYHGVTLPEKYGKQHPHQWKTQWLLEEKNAEMRRVLIQSIGYERICQELQATELDNWQDYTLLKIDERVDVEPIYLLKMTCPSTGYIHALRVPPDMQTAREAIRWVNWGIDPEEFSVQT